MLGFMQRQRDANKAITQAAMMCVIVRLSVCVSVCLSAGMIAGCSTSTQPRANPTDAQTDTPQCRAPGHFCQTFFGP